LLSNVGKEFKCNVKHDACRLVAGEEKQTEQGGKNEMCAVCGGAVVESHGWQKGNAPQLLRHAVLPLPVHAGRQGVAFVSRPCRDREREATGQARPYSSPFSKREKTFL